MENTLELISLIPQCQSCMDSPADIWQRLPGWSNPSRERRGPHRVWAGLGVRGSPGWMRNLRRCFLPRGGTHISLPRFPGLEVSLAFLCPRDSVCSAGITLPPFPPAFPVVFSPSCGIPGCFLPSVGWKPHSCFFSIKSHLGDSSELQPLVLFYLHPFLPWVNNSEG